MKRKHYVEISRKLESIDACDSCGGIVFNFRIEQLDLYTFIAREEILKIREMVSKGANLDQLMEEFEGIGLEEFEYSECEKCGRTWSSPTSGGR
jgi:hypothetical protein